MSEAEEQVLPEISLTDFGYRLIIGIAHATRERLGGVRTGRLLLELSTVRAHQAVRQTYQWLEQDDGTEYSLRFRIYLHQMYGYSGDWHECLDEEEYLQLISRDLHYRWPGCYWLNLTADEVDERLQAFGDQVSLWKLAGKCFDDALMAQSATDTNLRYC